MRRGAGRLIAACLFLPAFTTGQEEVCMQLPSGGQAFFATRGPSSFRVRLVAPGVTRGPVDTPMVSPDGPDAPFETAREADGAVITTAWGSLKVTNAGVLSLSNNMGKFLMQSDPINVGAATLVLSTKEGVLYGRGASPDDCTSLTAKVSTPIVINRGTYSPYYYSTDGYGALGVVDQTNAQKLPLQYRTENGKIIWIWRGSFDLYLTPASTLRTGTEAYYRLVGAPRVPPRYAFGFMASRWGWEGRQYIEDTVNQFRNDRYPIDGIICDFEWFTTESDYAFTPAGKPDYQDFGYNPATFDQPAEQLAKFRSMNIRVGGIRKPRLGNTALLGQARESGWILQTAEPAGAWPPDYAGSYAKERCLNFANPAVRDWYAENLAHFLVDGMSFWWNDEGETDYFTFHWWNVAQIQSLQKVDANRRFYSLNRAWSPGMAKLGATVWTGDINPTWEDLAKTPGMMLNWVLGGAPYVAVDIGGFTGDTNANLLSRWMQVGAFMTTMRVHSTHTAKPHWPWLWGPEAANAMRMALELRYRLVPYHYSLAHHMFKDQWQWIRPLVMDWPEDSNTWNIVSEWMDGEILVAPIMKEDSTKSVYLPAGTWYPLAASDCSRGDGRPIEGPTRLSGPAPLTEIPAFVRAGTLLTLAPVLQSTAELPGGPLEVQIYGGADATFSFVEDDGESTAYESGETRIIDFVWSESAQKLSWSSYGYIFCPGPRAFKNVKATLIDRTGSKTSEVHPLGVVGAITMSDQYSI